MLLVVISGSATHTVHTSDPCDKEMLLQMIAAETSIPPNLIEIQHNGRTIDLVAVSASTHIDTLGIKENDILMVSQKKGKMTIHDVPGNITPDALLALVKEHPHLLQQYNNADPDLGAIIGSNDIVKLRTVMMQRYMSHSKAKFERDEVERRIYANPDSEENQQLMAERIRLENIQQNMEMAIENLPEAFGRVIMLYVNVEINGHPVKAFVDSGAQSTIMSVDCATRCGLMRLVDTRFAGEARGVGTAKILGKVHIAQMKFGSTFFPVSITILEKNDVDFLFGLDMLKRYRCNIDLAENCLRVDGGRENVSFLSEYDLPSHMRSTAAEDLAPPPPQAQSASSSASAPAASTSASVPAPGFQGDPPASPGPTVGAGAGAGDADAGVRYLIELGFPEQLARQALTQTGGDIDLAASLLFGGLE